MTTTLIDNLTATNPSTNPGTLELKAKDSSNQNGLNFGQFMSEFFQQQEESPKAENAVESALIEPTGQEVADPLAVGHLGSMLDNPNWPLKAVTLGPHLNAITPDSSGPDAQSLEAFARAQGLDEQAVHWLLGGATGHDPQLTKPDAVAQIDVVNGAGVEGLGVVKGLGMVEGQPLGIDPQTTTALNPTASTQISPPNPTSPIKGDGSAQISPPNPTLPVKGDGSAPGTVVSALLGIQALWSSEEASVAPPKTNTLTSSDEALPIQMLRMPAPAAVWMQRTVLNSVLQDKVSTQKESAVSISELDLGTDWGGEILQELLVTEGGTTSTGTHGTAYANFASRWEAQATQRNDLTLANSPAQDMPDTQARSESIQNLADKMGQAVGQRILSEMEKGQWHLKLQLRPATLGHIEVEMRMRSGEFDAIFTAPNAITRDLLQDGLGKLRETLAQMGMDVANIHVDSGQTGQSGGDPTSGSPRGKTPQEGVSVPESVAESPRAPRVKDPKNGLDVLV